MDVVRPCMRLKPLRVAGGDLPAGAGGCRRPDEEVDPVRPAWHKSEPPPCAPSDVLRARARAGGKPARRQVGHGGEKSSLPANQGLTTWCSEEATSTRWSTCSERTCAPTSAASSLLAGATDAADSSEPEPRTEEEHRRDGGAPGRDSGRSSRSPRARPARRPDRESAVSPIRAAPMTARSWGDSLAAYRKAIEASPISSRQRAQPRRCSSHQARAAAPSSPSTYAPSSGTKACGQPPVILPSPVSRARAGAGCGPGRAAT